jgi:phenylalanyl-tRNA synthetase beta chain
MPTITIDKDAFEHFAGKKLPLDQLKDRISMLGTDLEGIEGNEITVEVFPNRPDMLSVQGFARAFSSFTGEKTGLRKYNVEDSGFEVIVDKSVKDVRPYTACAIVKGIHYDDQRIKEVIMIQEKLHVTYGRNRKKVAIGIYPMEKIKMPIHFLAKSPEDIVFQPLEFPKAVNGKQILMHHPAGKEYAHLLAGKTTYPIFTDGSGEIMSMPPIINSHKTGRVSHETKDVFIECSGFDLAVLQKCLNMIVTAMADMGGKICSMNIRYPDKTIVTPDLSPTEMDIDLDYINQRLGLSLKEADLKKLLARMGFGYEKKKVLIPSYRADILHQIDFAEDIAIAYGYENFDGILPTCGTVGQEQQFEIIKAKIADALVGLGMIETHTNNLTNKDNQVRKMCADLDVIELANSISEEYNILRAWVLPSLMEILQSNKHNEYPQNIFGYGTVFKHSSSTDTGILEDERLSVLLCSENADYTKARQTLDYLFRCLDIKYHVEDTEHPSFIPGRVARVSALGRKLAYIGELKPEVLENWGIELPVAGFELNISELAEAIQKEKE